MCIYIYTCIHIIHIHIYTRIYPYTLVDVDVCFFVYIVLMVTPSAQPPKAKTPLFAASLFPCARRCYQCTETSVNTHEKQVSFSLQLTCPRNISVNQTLNRDLEERKK